MEKYLDRSLKSGRSPCMKPVLHHLRPRERVWLEKAIKIASAQSEDAPGEQIDFWLRPIPKLDFNGNDISTEEESLADGPYPVADPRCNHGTLSDSEVFEYVELMYGQPPLMFVRKPWGLTHEMVGEMLYGVRD